MDANLENAVSERAGFWPVEILSRALGKEIQQGEPVTSPSKVSGTTDLARTEQRTAPRRHCPKGRDSRAMQPGRNRQSRLANAAMTDAVLRDNEMPRPDTSRSAVVAT